MRSIPAVSVLASLAMLNTIAHACPFCTAVSKTFSEEIDSMDAVAIARLTEAPPVPDAATDPDAPLPKAKFRVDEVLKGDKWTKASDVIEVLYFGDPDKDKRYLIMGTDPPQLMWSTPLGLSERAYKYITALPGVAQDSTRLEFFQEHLEDEDEMLARDAYDEFANAPYEDLIALRDKMKHDRLVEWVQDPDLPASRRRLYFTMLGVCGQPKDAVLLEGFMKSDDRKAKSGLDALIACYMILKGEDGLNDVDELFLKNQKAEYADTYAAIMAIRFHGTQTDVIDRKRLVLSLRYMLERPELADLVIPDLAKWQDWEVMPRLVELFKNADEKSSWVRVPVINYLRACPLPEAKVYIEKLSEIDPDAVKRAKTFFPFDPAGDAPGTGEKPSGKETSMVPPAASPDEQTVAVADLAEPDLQVAQATGPATSPDAPPARAGGRQDEILVAGVQPWEPNMVQLLGVPVVAGLVLLVVYRIVLGVPRVQRSQEGPR